MLLMNESTRMIDSMDISERQKGQIYTQKKELQRYYLQMVGEIMSDYIDNDLVPNVEHTNQGLNLRIIVSDHDSVSNIIAIGDYFNLEIIQNKVTDSCNTHLRFRF